MGGNRLWQKLEKRVAQLVESFPGVAGVAVNDLVGGLSLQINAKEIFPTASTIKIHVLTQLLVRAEGGEVDLQERFTMPPPEPTFGSGVLAYLEGPVTLSLLDMAILMIIASDNTATNICIERAGLEETNKLIRQLGLESTRLRRKMMDHIAAVHEQENVATPAELVQMLTLLYEKQPSAWVAERAIEILKKPKSSFLHRGLPGGIEIANKPGWVEAARCDAGIVLLTHRPYVIAVMTKYAMCSNLDHENFMATLARTVHDTMEMLDKSNRYGRAVYT